MNDGGPAKPKRKVGKMPNLANMKLVYSDREPNQYELEHAKREIARLVLPALLKLYEERRAAEADGNHSDSDSQLT